MLYRQGKRLSTEKLLKLIAKHKLRSKSPKSLTELVVFLGHSPDDLSYRDKVDVLEKWAIENVQGLTYEARVEKGDSKVIVSSSCSMSGKDFYKSQVWKTARYFTLRKQRVCQCCGRGRPDGIVLHVDHIQPRSIRKDLALNLNNLQVLCEDCNLGKSNKDNTDWR